MSEQGDIKVIVLRSELDRKGALAHLYNLNLDHKLKEVVIREHKSSRSLRQNNLYGLWISLLAAHTGNSSRALREFFKREFLPVVYEKVNGQLVETLTSTADLNVKEMSEFLQQVESFAATELNLTLMSEEATEQWHKKMK